MDPKKVPIKPKRKSSSKKIIYWIIAILVFYVFTSASVSQGTVEVEKTIEQKYTENKVNVAEKTVNTTKYKTERVPYGEPRCEQTNYNFSYTKAYSEEIIADKKIGTCTFEVTNQEEIDGTFSFYVQFLRNGAISDSIDQTQVISAFGTKAYKWKLTVGIADSLNCMMQSNNPPTRMKCFYLEPITYQIKQVPYTVQETKNVTEVVPVQKTRTVIEKQNVTQNIYTNKFFGYRQFLYLGY
jgi:hypothetical protein